MATKKTTKIIDKYKAIVTLDDYYGNIEATGITADNKKKLYNGEALEAKDLGEQFDYMLKNKLIEKE